MVGNGPRSGTATSETMGGLRGNCLLQVGRLSTKNLSGRVKALLAGGFQLLPGKGFKQGARRKDYDPHKPLIPPGLGTTVSKSSRHIKRIESGLKRVATSGARAASLWRS